MDREGQVSKEIYILFRQGFFSTSDSPTYLYIFLLQHSLSLPKFEGKRGEVVWYHNSKHKFWDLGALLQIPTWLFFEQVA